MRRVRRLACIAAALAAFMGLGAGRAGATYIIQPHDGANVSTSSPTFLVWLDGNELNPEVEISTSPDHTDFGFIQDVSFCFPTVPWKEPHKYTCNSAFSLTPGTYYWLLTYETYGCRTIDYGYGSFQYCGYNFQVSGPFKFTVGPAGSGLPTRGGPADGQSRTDPFYTQIARTISRGMTQAVDCFVGADWETVTANHGIPPGYVELGFVDPLISPNEVELSPDVCTSLDLLHYQTPRAPANLDVAIAVDTLAHEAIHTLGIYDEAVTECYAGQEIAWTAMQLGAPYAYARRLASLWWANYRNEPPGYWTPDCRNNGRLDLNRRSKVWP
ncbi:MAG: hypothetical protein IRZ20_03835 [Thermoleophilia bacterium]|nr:hypothetical protein [Thermoleophilia bacterium]